MISVSMSASFFWISWFLANGTPNCILGRYSQGKLKYVCEGAQPPVLSQGPMGPGSLSRLPQPLHSTPWPVIDSAHYCSEGLPWPFHRAGSLGLVGGDLGVTSGLKGGT